VATALWVAARENDKKALRRLERQALNYLEGRRAEAEQLAAKATSHAEVSKLLCRDDLFPTSLPTIKGVDRKHRLRDFLGHCRGAKRMLKSWPPEFVVQHLATQLVLLFAQYGRPDDTRCAQTAARLKKMAKSQNVPLSALDEEKLMLEIMCLVIRAEERHTLQNWIDSALRKI
jgi:hypothetical protein